MLKIITIQILALAICGFFAFWLGAPSTIVKNMESGSPKNAVSHPGINSIVSAKVNTNVRPADHRNADLIEFDQRRRDQSILDDKEYTPISTVPWSGIQNAEWCQASTEPRLPYEDCEWDTWIFKFGVHGGLTNALHFILKGM